MPDNDVDTTVAHQVELAVKKLNTLCAWPGAVANLLEQLLNFNATPQSLAEIIKADPALTAKLLTLANSENTQSRNNSFSVEQTIESLDLNKIRSTALSVDLYNTLQKNQNHINLRKQLITCSITTACCAENIAKSLSSDVNPELAYTAGLLHNLGLLALDDVMPRSFAAIVAEAQSHNAALPAGQMADLSRIEQKHLGIDHSLLGKRLAQKWHLPTDVQFAVWLNEAQNLAGAQNIPQMKLPMIVRLAHILACRQNMGWPGSFPQEQAVDETAQCLGLNRQQIEQIKTDSIEAANRKITLAAIESPDVYFNCSRVIRQTANTIADDNTQISRLNDRLRTASSDVRFITDFIAKLHPQDSQIETAEKLALTWKTFYQTGRVCVYIRNTDDPDYLDAFVTEQSKTKSYYLKGPEELLPAQTLREDIILDAQLCCPWLFEQLDLKFDLERTKALPLYCSGEAIGAVVFELNQPASQQALQQAFKVTGQIAGSFLASALAAAQQEHLAEQFAGLINNPPKKQLSPPAQKTDRPLQRPAEQPDTIDALAEIAAGAAHELNNPLSVISGRAQLLAEAETDERKKQILRQIRENASGISDILGDLMSFANPPQPRPAQTDVKQVLEEAEQLAVIKTRIEEPNFKTELKEPLPLLYIDSAQAASALANVLANSLEAYADQYGKVDLVVELDEMSNFIKITVIDNGYGMDAETLKKALHPFFSAKPAGRKRGMGLAHASRLIELNGGRMKIQSSRSGGTVVEILLPIAS